jgi:phytoene dehydrogenase-like protein
MPDRERPVIIIGGGLAGLVAARNLHRHGVDVLVLEAAAQVGGRVRSRRTGDGFLIDRGFQIFLSGYPALRRTVDLDGLGVRPFDSGAHVWSGRRLLPLRNPLRHPTGIFRDLTSPVFGIGDKLRLARWGAEVAAAPWTSSAEAANELPNRSALDALRDRGFSDAFIDRFAKPFWGGIALDRSLSFSAGVLLFTTKMFLAGDAVLPRHGIGAVPSAIAGDLPDRAVRTDTSVEALVLDGNRVTGVRAAGEVINTAAVIVATDPLTAARLTGIASIPTEGVGCVTVYLATRRDPGIGRVLTIDGTGHQPVNHIAPLSGIQPTYAPEGEHLLAAVMLGEAPLHRDADDNGRIARESAATMLGLSDLRVVDVVDVPFSLYRQVPGIHRHLPDATTGVRGLWLASDATVDASTNGAIMSGEDAAHAVLMAGGIGE